jgi:hypothetical protein
MKCYLVSVVSLLACGMLACNSDVESEYYESGALKSKIHIENGMAEGEVSLYYENGRLEARGNFHLGLEEGKVEWFYPNGELKERYFYSGGELNGTVVKYYPGEKIKIKTEYRKGQRVGMRFRYFGDGHLSEFACLDSLGNLYYLTQWDAHHNRIMQAFMPVFTVEAANDSTLLFIQRMIFTNGVANLSIGLWDKINDINPLITTTMGNTTEVIAIPKTIDPNDLFYKIRFEATENDTINGFEFIKKVIVNDTLRDDHKRIEIAFNQQ